jgi:hypothetical protein
MEPANASQLVLFIPDISGFTKFVAETEINHSQHIIGELLEILVDSNSIGLKISEIEGDAILFFRPGAPPSAKQLVEQARTMFVNFHTQLKRYEFLRLCQCGACVGANQLTLKIVAHFGPASVVQVRQHAKLIGKDVIVAHRLLKNSLEQREYLLLTRELLAALKESNGSLEGFADGVDSYEEIGAVEYKYLPLTKYREEVKCEKPEPFTVKNPHKEMELLQHIQAPAERVYQTLIDLPGRMNWIEGIKRVELRDDKPNQLGTKHRCVRDPTDPEIVTGDVEVTDTSFEFWETDVKKLVSVKYCVKRVAANGTELVVEIFVRGNILVKAIFRALLKRKLKRNFEMSMKNLAALCEQHAR